MFLRNYDVMKLLNTFPYDSLKDKDVLSIDENSNLYFRNYLGKSFSIDFPISSAWPRTSRFAAWGMGNYREYPFGTEGIDGSSTNIQDDILFLWPGGECSKKHRHFPGIKAGEVQYTDYNLYRPFYGQKTQTDTNEIQALYYYLSESFYDNGVWKRVFTTDFKNVSGETITVKEFGIFSEKNSESILLAREVFSSSEEIIVEPDTYFKISFTFECQNPYEHQNKTTVREYSYLTTYPQMQSTTLKYSSPYFVAGVYTTNSPSTEPTFEGATAVEIFDWQPFDSSNSRFRLYVGEITDPKEGYRFSSNVSSTYSYIESFSISKVLYESILRKKDTIENPVAITTGNEKVITFNKNNPNPSLFCVLKAPVSTTSTTGGSVGFYETEGEICDYIKGSGGTYMWTNWFADNRKDTGSRSFSTDTAARLAVIEIPTGLDKLFHSETV